MSGFEWIATFVIAGLALAVMIWAAAGVIGGIVENLLRRRERAHVRSTIGAAFFDMQRQAAEEWQRDFRGWRENGFDKVWRR